MLNLPSAAHLVGGGFVGGAFIGWVAMRCCLHAPATDSGTTLLRVPLSLCPWSLRRFLQVYAGGKQPGDRALLEVALTLLLCACRSPWCIAGVCPRQQQPPHRVLCVASQGRMGGAEDGAGGALLDQRPGQGTL